MRIFGRELRFEKKAAAANPLYRSLLALIYGRDVIWPDRDYASLARVGYQKLDCVYACVSKRAKACAGIKWIARTVSRGRDGKANYTDLDENHPLSILFRRPNPGQGWSRFFDESIRYRMLSGNEYMFLNAPKSSPPSRVELFNLRPDRVTVNPGDAANRVRGYTYAKGTAAETFFPAEVILHLKEFHPTDDWYGLSPCEVALQDIHTLNLASRWNAKLLQNDARPAGLLRTPVGTSLTDEQFDRLKKLIHEHVLGAENAGLPVGPLEGGLEFQAYGLNPKEMDWLKLDKHTRRKIATTLGTPSELIGDAENKTYSNYQEARKGFYLETILPDMDEQRDEFENWLIPIFGDNIRLDYDRDSIEAIREDRSKLVVDLNSLLDHGIISRNELREELKWEEGGPEMDVRTVSGIVTPLDAVAPPLDETED